MNKKLLDILVCPFDKVTSLELFEFQSAAPELSNGNSSLDTPNKKITLEHGSKPDVVSIEDSDSYQAKTIKTNDLAANGNGIVKEGLLLCRSCLRFYPITEEIPIILPDELRDKKKDIEFLKKWREFIPEQLSGSLKPWTF
ncbi:MAG: Trm112 family protein [Candidatus Nitrosocosmicus sp.]